MEDLLINFDEKAYESKVEKLESFIPLFKNAIGIYNSFGISMFEPKDFNQLFLDTKNFIFEKTVGEKTISLNGIPISKSKLFDLVEKPKGYYILEEKIQQIDRIFQSKKTDFRFTGFNDLLRSFEFTTDDEIVLKQCFYDDFKREYETFVSSEKAKKMYHFGKDLLALYIKFDVSIKSNQDNEILLKGLFNFESGTPVINPHYISMVDINAQGKR